MFKSLTLLIAYFIPEVSVFFKSIQILPEYFANSWILTAFAVKIEEVSLIYILWEELAWADDPYFLVLLCVGFLDINKEKILECDHTGCLMYIGSMSIPDLATLENIIEKARFYQKTMPQSSWNFFHTFNVFDLASIDQKLMAFSEINYVQTMPNDFFKALYPEILCQGRTNGNILYVLIDCRLEKDQNAGYFSNSALFRLEDLLDSLKILRFTQNFNGLKGFCHFVVMGDDEVDSKKPVNLILEALMKEKFPFVSTAKGGYVESHKFAEAKGLKIKNHNENLCKVCLENKGLLQRFSNYMRQSKKISKQEEK